MSDVVMNGRVLLVPSNGQKRVAEEIAHRLQLQSVAPAARMASGAKGHLWEQAMLPLIMRGRPLWSPSTSAPVLYRNQVVTVHDIGFVDVPQFYAPRFAQIYRQIVGQVVHRARHLVTVSEFSAQRIVDHYGVPRERVTAIYPGISAAFRLRGESEVAAVREHFKLGDERYVIAFSGADPRKNTKGVLEAWALANARAKLVLFGRHSNASVFNTGAATPDPEGVVRVGGVSDDELAALYSGAAAMVFPSFYEGFGLPIVEAAASGAPVICSGIGAMREVAPLSARLVDPADSREIARAILSCLTDPPSRAEREQLVAETGRYSWDTAADAYRQLFETVFA